MIDTKHTSFIHDTITGYPYGYPFSHSVISEAQKSLMGKIDEAIEKINKFEDEEMEIEKSYEITNCDIGVNVVIPLPGILKEEISVKFQKDNYVVRVNIDDGHLYQIEIPFWEIDENSDANLDKDIQPEITLSHGILNIFVPYMIEETVELPIIED